MQSTTIDLPTTPRRRWTRSWGLLLLAALVLPVFIAPTLAELNGWRLHRVVSRMMIAGSVVVLLCWFGRPRRADLIAALGPRTLRSAGLALATGIAFCCAYSGLLILLGCESIRPTLYRAERIPLGLLTGLVVSAIEEPLFRRILLRKLSVRGSAVAGAILASMLYALIHYVRPAKTAVQQDCSMADSLAVYQDMLANLLNPLRDPAPFIGLFLLGLLLCAVVRRGGLAWTIGIHASVVFYLKSTGSVFYWNHPERHWLYGSMNHLYDGALFWIVCASLLAIVLVLPRRKGTLET